MDLFLFPMLKVERRTENERIKGEEEEREEEEKEEKKTRKRRRS